MKHIFLGKPDKKFPNLVRGAIYDLDIVVDDTIKIVEPFKCPYDTWKAFFDNWKPVA